MDHFAMLTPHEQLVETVLHIYGLTWFIVQKRLQVARTFYQGFM